MGVMTEQALFGWHAAAPGDEEAMAAFEARLRACWGGLHRVGRVDARQGLLCARLTGCAADEGVGLAWDGTVRQRSAPDGPAGERLAGTYRRAGIGMVESLGGGFALALCDRTGDRTLLALDRVGQRALYFARVGEGLVYATRLGDLLLHPAVEAEWSPQAIYEYVYFHYCPSPDTVYRGIGKLEGAECLVFEGGRLRRFHYWVPDFSRPAGVSAEALGTRLLETLGEAVRREATEAGTVGAFLSGGLDSSTVAGLLARVHPDACHTFSIGFEAPEYDEREYARAAVEHFGTRQHEFVVQPEMAVEAVQEIAAFYDEPFGNSSALPALFCARHAAGAGVRRLLAGDGGDELFAGNERYLKQLVFERYARVPRLLRAALEGTLGVLPDAAFRLSLLHKARRYVEQAGTPLPDRLQDYNFLHRHAPPEVFEPDFLAAVDPERPLASLREVYHRPEGADALDRMLYLDWKITLHDNDLVKVNRMCALGGVEVRYPMLDDDVVELSLQVPSTLKLEGGRLRGFYKRAMRGFLPERILNKPKHGFGLPFGLWLSEHAPLRELAYDSIASLRARGIFRGAFLDHAVEMHRSVHAAYYGELIWILMMLERWFDAHPGRAR